MDDIRLIGGAEGIDHLAENERHDRLREAVGDGANGADGHQRDVEAIRECEELEEGDFLSLIIGRGRRCGRVSAVHGGGVRVVPRVSNSNSISGAPQIW